MTAFPLSPAEATAVRELIVFSSEVHGDLDAPEESLYERLGQTGDGASLSTSERELVAELLRFAAEVHGEISEIEEQLFERLQSA